MKPSSTMDRDTFNNTAQHSTAQRFDEMKIVQHLCAMCGAAKRQLTPTNTRCVRTVAATTTSEQKKKQSNTSVAINYVSDSHSHTSQYTIDGRDKTRKLIHNYHGNSFRAANANENDEKKTGGPEKDVGRAREATIIVTACVQQYYCRCCHHHCYCIFQWRWSGWANCDCPVLNV